MTFLAEKSFSKYIVIGHFFTSTFIKGQIKGLYIFCDARTSRTFTHTHTHTYTHTHTHTRTCTHIHTYTHTYTHTNTNMNLCFIEVIDGWSARKAAGNDDQLFCAIFFHALFRLLLGLEVPKMLVLFNFHKFLTIFGIF